MTDAEFTETWQPVLERWPNITEFETRMVRGWWRNRPQAPLERIVSQVVADTKFRPKMSSFRPPSVDMEPTPGQKRRATYKAGDSVEVDERYAEKEENGRFWGRIGTDEQHRISSACCKGMLSPNYADRVQAIDTFLAEARRIGWPVDERPYASHREYYAHKQGEVPASALFADGKTAIPF